MKFRAFAVRPEHPGELREIEIEEDLAVMQAFVGGYIQAVPLGDGLLLVCDEEANLKADPPPFTAAVEGLGLIRGPFFVCRQGGVHFASIEEDDGPRVRAIVTPGV